MNEGNALESISESIGLRLMNLETLANESHENEDELQSNCNRNIGCTINTHVHENMESVNANLMPSHSVNGKQRILNSNFYKERKPEDRWEILTLYKDLEHSEVMQFDKSDRVEEFKDRGFKWCDSLFDTYQNKILGNALNDAEFLFQENANKSWASINSLELTPDINLDNFELQNNSIYNNRSCQLQHNEELASDGGLQYTQYTQYCGSNKEDICGNAACSSNTAMEVYDVIRSQKESFEFLSDIICEEPLLPECKINEINTAMSDQSLPVGIEREQERKDSTSTSSNKTQGFYNNYEENVSLKNLFSFGERNVKEDSGYISSSSERLSQTQFEVVLKDSALLEHSVHEKRKKCQGKTVGDKRKKRMQRCMSTNCDGISTVPEHFQDINFNASLDESSIKDCNTKQNIDCNVLSLPEKRKIQRQSDGLEDSVSSEQVPQNKNIMGKKINKFKRHRTKKRMKLKEDHCCGEKFKPYDGNQYKGKYKQENCKFKFARMRNEIVDNDGNLLCSPGKGLQKNSNICLEDSSVNEHIMQRKKCHLETVHAKNKQKDLESIHCDSDNVGHLTESNSPLRMKINLLKKKVVYCGHISKRSDSRKKIKRNETTDDERSRESQFMRHRDQNTEFCQGEGMNDNSEEQLQSPAEDCGDVGKVENGCMLPPLEDKDVQGNVFKKRIVRYVHKEKLCNSNFDSTDISNEHTGPAIIDKRKHGKENQKSNAFAKTRKLETHDTCGIIKEPTCSSPSISHKKKVIICKKKTPKRLKTPKAKAEPNSKIMKKTRYLTVTCDQMFDNDNSDSVELCDNKNLQSLNHGELFAGQKFPEHRTDENVHQCSYVRDFINCTENIKSNQVFDCKTYVEIQKNEINVLGGECVINHCNSSYEGDDCMHLQDTFKPKEISKDNANEKWTNSNSENIVEIDDRNKKCSLPGFPNISKNGIQKTQNSLDCGTLSKLLSNGAPENSDVIDQSNLSYVLTSRTVSEDCGLTYNDVLNLDFAPESILSYQDNKNNINKETVKSFVCEDDNLRRSFDTSVASEYDTAIIDFDLEIHSDMSLSVNQETSVDWSNVNSLKLLEEVNALKAATVDLKSAAGEIRNVKQIMESKDCLIKSLQARLEQYESNQLYKILKHIISEVEQTSTDEMTSASAIVRILLSYKEEKNLGMGSVQETLL